MLVQVSGATTAKMIARLFTLSLFISVFGFASLALAQNKEANDLEKAIFAYFALAGKPPDYAQWIRNSEKYRHEKDPVRKEEIYETETLRLKWGYGVYSPEKDYIKLRTPVRLFLMQDEKNPVLYFAFSAENPDYVPYFPFPYGNEWITMIAYDLERFLSIPLSAEEYKFVAGIMEPNRPHDGAVTLHLRGTKADTAATMNMDGTDHWLMMGETGFIELFYAPPDRTEKSIWSYEAPWFYTKTEKDLFPLLGQ